MTHKDNWVLNNRKNNTFNNGAETIQHLHAKEDWGYSSEVECLLSMQKTLGLISSTEKKGGETVETYYKVDKSQKYYANSKK